METIVSLVTLIVVVVLLVLLSKLDSICLSYKVWQRLELAAGIILLLSIYLALLGAISGQGQ